MLMDAEKVLMGLTLELVDATRVVLEHRSLIGVDLLPTAWEDRKKQAILNRALRDIELIEQRMEIFAAKMKAVDLATVGHAPKSPAKAPRSAQNDEKVYNPIETQNAPSVAKTRKNTKGKASAKISNIRQDVRNCQQEPPEQCEKSKRKEEQAREGYWQGQETGRPSKRRSPEVQKEVKRLLAFERKNGRLPRGGIKRAAIKLGITPRTMGTAIKEGRLAAQDSQI